MNIIINLKNMGFENEGFNTTEKPNEEESKYETLKNYLNELSDERIAEIRKVLLPTEDVIFEDSFKPLFGDKYNLKPNSREDNISFILGITKNNSLSLEALEGILRLDKKQQELKDLKEN